MSHSSSAALKNINRGQTTTSTAGATGIIDGTRFTVYNVNSQPLRPSSSINSGSTTFSPPGGINNMDVHNMWPNASITLKHRSSGTSKERMDNVMGSGAQT